jgi:hypothetical protein
MREGRSDPPARPRGRVGCLGSLLVLVAAAIGSGVFAYFVAPWNFNFGGHFHPLGGWQGWGRFHSASGGGDYDMWVRFEITIPKRLKSPLSGTAIVCTPRGERLKLNLLGSMPREHRADLANVPLHLYMNRIAPLATTIDDRRPHLDLWGAFGDSVLEVEDRGSIGRAFAPDGTVRTSDAKVPRGAENIHITFKEVPMSALPPDCPRPAP